MTTTAVHRPVGFIGLGVMGAPMARHLLRALPEPGLLHVWSRRPSSSDDLVALGATRSDSPASLAREVDAVILMVPTFDDVRSLLEGDDGLVAGARDLVIVVSSTTSPEDMRELDSELRARTADRVRVVDAPVSGGEEGAIRGDLSIMVGGDERDTARASAILSAFGSPRRLGAIGAGQLAKACNQMIVAATVTSIAEAAVVAERAGLDLAALFDVLEGGYAASRILSSKRRRFETHDHSPSGAARFMIKDLGYALAEAQRTGTSVPQTTVLLRMFTELTERGLGDADTAVMQRFVGELDAGSEPQQDLP